MNATTLTQTRIICADNFVRSKRPPVTMVRATNARPKWYNHCSDCTAVWLCKKKLLVPRNLLLSISACELEFRGLDGIESGKSTSFRYGFRCGFHWWTLLHLFWTCHQLQMPMQNPMTTKSQHKYNCSACFWTFVSDVKKKRGGGWYEGIAH